MSDRVTSWLRTVIPGAWATLIVWLAAQLDWLPTSVVDWLSSEATVGVVVVAALAGWYALWRWLEPRLPDWLTRLVLGAARTPVYVSPGAAAAITGSAIDDSDDEEGPGR